MAVQLIIVKPLLTVCFDFYAVCDFRFDCAEGERSGGKRFFGPYLAVLSGNQPYCAGKSVRFRSFCYRFWGCNPDTNHGELTQRTRRRRTGQGAETGAAMPV